MENIGSKEGMGRIDEDDEEESKSKKSRSFFNHKIKKGDDCSKHEGNLHTSTDDLSMGSSEGSSIDGGDDDEDRIIEQMFAA